MPDFLYAADESALQKLVRAPLLALEGPYRLGAFLHRRLYDWGLRRVARLPVPVVSIGNLCAGGSAKTPVVRWLAESLAARDRAVVVLSRGVGGRSRQRVNVVSDGQRVLLGASQVGDEPVWLAQGLSGVPVLAGRDRHATGLRAAALFGCECILLDDGFQHHRLARDVDLVCIDARLGLGNGHALPRGPLRESTAALRRASAVLFTRVPAEDPPPARPRGLPEKTPTFRVDVVPRALRDVASGERLPLEELRGERVGGFAGLARPQSLRRTLQSLGAIVSEFRVFPDHHAYTREDLGSLDRSLRWITTGKDAVKIPPTWLEGRSVAWVEERVEEPPEQALVDWLVGQLAPGAGTRP